MISFQRVLVDKSKRYVLVYSRHVHAVRGMRDFFDLVKDQGASLFECSRTVKFPEGGFARFMHVDDEFRGMEFDWYEVDEAVTDRMDQGVPLLTLLATRKRPSKRLDKKIKQAVIRTSRQRPRSK